MESGTSVTEPIYLLFQNFPFINFSWEGIIAHILKLYKSRKKMTPKGIEPLTYGLRDRYRKKNPLNYQCYTLFSEFKIKNLLKFIKFF